MLQGGKAGPATTAPNIIFVSPYYIAASGEINFRATAGHSTVPVDWFVFGRA